MRNISSHKLTDMYGVHDKNNYFCQYLFKNIESPVYLEHTSRARMNTVTFD
jgi:hypothetical protein